MAAANELQVEVARMADEAYEMVRALTGHLLDFSEASLGLVEDTLNASSAHFKNLTGDQATRLAQRMGCYILEVARRQFGGTYHWAPDHGQPVLVVGEPVYFVGIMAWNRVGLRLAGDPGENILLLFARFAEAVRSGAPGTRTLFV